MNKKHKLFSFLFLLGLTFQIFSISFLGRASAQTAQQYTPEQIGKAWQVGIALGNCAVGGGVQSGFYKERDVAAMEAGLIFRHSDLKVVGRLTDPEDGEIKCNDSDDIKLLLDAINQAPIKFLREAGVYKLQTNKYVFSASSNEDAQKKIKAQVEKLFNFKYSNGLSGATKYALLLAPFKDQCLGSEDPGGTQVTLVESNGTIPNPPKKYALKGGGNDVVEVGYSVDSNNEMSCTRIASELNKYADDYSKRLKALNSAGVDTSSSGISADGADVPTCETSGFSLSWIICPIVTGIAETSDAIFNSIIQPLLVARDLGYTDPNNKSGLFDVWSSFRVIANIILIIALLLIVFGQSIGGGLIDAYTAKKALPRVFVAAILINISIYLVVFALDISNIVGQGLNGLLLAPFQANNGSIIQLSSGGGIGIALTSAIGGGALFAAAGLTGGGVLILVLLGVAIALLAFLAVLITLIIRQGLIILLVLLSPLAFAMYVLPNTEQYFKKWWNLLFKTLLVYPIIMCILAISYALSTLLSGIFPEGVQWAADIVSILLLVIPLFMVPFAFKMAGGAMGSLFGMLNNNPLKKLASGAAQKQTSKGFGETANRTKGGKIFRSAPTGSLRSRLNRGAQAVGHVDKLGFRPGNWSSNLAAAVGNYDNHEVEEALKDGEYATWMGNDGLNKHAAASTSAEDLEQRLREDTSSYSTYRDPVTGALNTEGERQLRTDVARVERMRRKMSNEAFQQLTTRQAVAGGTAFDTGSEWLLAAAQASHGDDAALADQIAKGRSAAMSAGRVDQGGAGFGATFNLAKEAQALHAQRQAGTITAQQYDAGMSDINSRLHKAVLESQGPGTIVHPSMKESAIREMVPELRQRLQTAYDSGDQAQIDRELAVISSMHDELSRTAPNKARVIADEVMRWAPEGSASQQPLAVGQQGPVLPGGRTVQEDMDSRRTSPVFQSTHKEYTSAFEGDRNRPVRPPDLDGGATPPIIPQM